MTQRIVLAFDIERSGATNEYDTIGIGASVLNDKLEELDSLFLPCYFPPKTKFEQRCWDEFWSKNLDQLEILTYEGNLSKEERENEMIHEFHNFRKKWEQIANEKGII